MMHRQSQSLHYFSQICAPFTYICYSKMCPGCFWAWCAFCVNNFRD
uniref:Uncharacterized protein n=1 Tax=Anguilla anguilla TaxID=7936 RepID=A0A0E9V167_ANGAN